VAANGNLNPELVPVRRWTGDAFGLQWAVIDDAGAVWVLSPEKARQRMQYLGIENAA
jgi:hypothetical protein